MHTICLAKHAIRSSIQESFTLLKIKRKMKAGKKGGKSLVNGKSKGSGRQKIDMGWGKEVFG